MTDSTLLSEIHEQPAVLRRLLREREGAVRNVAGALAGRGITSVVISHDMASVFRIADRIAMLTGGRFVEVSPPKTFVATDQPDVRKFLDAQFISKKGLEGF